VDGKRVTDQSQLRAIISAHKPGDTLSLTIRRDGTTKTVQATLGTRS
jgi:S1-C subfamily serine protease